MVRSSSRQAFEDPLKESRVNLQSLDFPNRAPDRKSLTETGLRRLFSFSVGTIDDPDTSAAMLDADAPCTNAGGSSDCKYFDTNIAPAEEETSVATRSAKDGTKLDPTPRKETSLESWLDRRRRF